MFYISTDNAVYQTNSAELAAALGTKPEEMGSNVMHIDFGGVLVDGMEYIDIEIDDRKYTLLAHHVGPLITELHAARVEASERGLRHVVLRGYPFSYAMSLSDAQRMEHIIAENWNEYHALELHNRHRYEEAIRALSGAPVVDVQRERAILKDHEVV
jgi:hypothetical protein